MATINVANLIIQMQQKICATTNERDLLYYAKAMQSLHTGIVFTAPTFGDLPAAASSYGELWFVVNVETLYIALPTYGWSPITTKKFYSLWAWGCNAGQLGNNTSIQRSSPVQEITSSTSWCVVNAGSATVAVRTDGTLWGWGCNASGQLGDNTSIVRSSPIQEVTSSTTWCTAVTSLAATATSAGIKTDGTLWTWGVGTCGVLGNNSTVTRSSPVREIASSTNWCAVAIAGHAAGIKLDGTLWSWGCNANGRVGDNTTICRSSAVQEITKSTTWCTLSVGCQVTAAVKTDGKLWSWGLNTCGQIGDNSVTSRSSPVQEITGSTIWRSVAAGYRHTAAIRTDGSLWTWGKNDFGQLGDNTSILRSSPVREISNSALWCQVAASESTLAVRTDGSLWTWGLNGCGQLGDLTVTNRSSPVRELTSSTTWFDAAAGRCHSTAIKLDCSR